MSEVPVTSEVPVVRDGVSRRTMLRLGAVGGAGVALVAAQGLGVPFLAQRGLLSADGAFAATSIALGDELFYIENFPTSPLILSPFTDPLPVPKALRPEPKAVYSAWPNPPGPGVGQQNSLRNETAPDLAEPRSGYSRTRSSTRSTCRFGPTPSPPRRCCRSTRTAGRRSRSTQSGKTFAAGTNGRCRPARSTASTAPSPGR